jgi:OOP family OmpA-OmpF porin
MNELQRSGRRITGDSPVHELHHKEEEMKRAHVNVFMVGLLFLSAIVLAGCEGMVFAPKNAMWYYPKELPAAENAVDTARQAGKDKQCPNEFKEAEKMKDGAYNTYWACRTAEGISMAKDAASKANALCPKVAVAAPMPSAPTVSLSVNPASIQQGECATLTWSSTNASKVSIDQEVGSVDPSGSHQVCPGSTTQYTITAAGEGGSRTASTTVSVTAPPPAPEPQVAPSPKVMVFPSAALFAVNKASLTPEGKKKIQEYREQVKEEMSRSEKVIITGHTDSTGTAEYNQKLSIRRAEAVRDYLISIGADASKMEVKGMGMTKPIADNKTAKGRAQNRRVEVEVIGVEK